VESNRWLVELESGSIQRLLRHASPLVGTAKSNTKTKSSAEEKTDLFMPAHSCSPKSLDTADFLIDGLTSAAPPALACQQSLAD
jgi:hypothetical protein